MKVGIIGLPSTGKSTLFQLLTGAPSPPLPAGVRSRGSGSHACPTRGSRALAEMYNPKKKTPATVEYVVTCRAWPRARARPSWTCPPCAAWTRLVHVVRASNPEVVPHPDRLDRPPARRAHAGAGADPGRPGHRSSARLERLDANIKKANKADDVARARRAPQDEGSAGSGEARCADLTLSEEEQRRRARLRLPLRQAVSCSWSEHGRGPGAEAAAALERMGLVGLRRRRQRARAVPGGRAHRGGDARSSRPEDAQAFREDLGSRSRASTA